MLHLLLATVMSSRRLKVHPIAAAGQTTIPHIRRIPNAKEGRGALEWEIFGMAGVPEGMMPGGPIPTGGEQSTLPATLATLLRSHHLLMTSESPCRTTAKRRFRSMWPAHCSPALQS